MPKCTPEEEAIDPCLCAFRNCQIDVAIAAHKIRAFVVENSPHPIPVGAALQFLAVIQQVADLGIAECAADFARCRGAESQPLRPFTPQQKAIFKGGADAISAHGAAGMFVSQAVKRAGPSKLGAVAFSIAVFGTALGAAGRRLRDIADDPTDHEHVQLPDVVPLQLPEIVPGDFLSEIEAELLNALLRNLGTGISLATAMVSAINRAQGAALGGISDGASAQLSVARTFATQWADSLEQTAGLRSQVAVVLAELDPFELAKPEALQIKGDIVANGWPQEIGDIAAVFGTSSHDVDALLRKATSLLNEVPHPANNLAASFVSTVLDTSETEIASVLREFGAKREGPPS